MLDLEFANDVMTEPGEAADREAPKRERAKARAEAAARFRKGGRARGKR
jgi:excinuclease ABC subunit B